MHFYILHEASRLLLLGATPCGRGGLPHDKVVLHELNFVLSQFLLELSDNFKCLLHLLRLRVLDFIHGDCSLDVLCFLPEVKRRDCLLVAALCLGDRANDSCGRVATDGFLKDPGQLRVSIVYELLRACRQLIYHI